jgi:SAM-dependent methyltransferase
MTATSLDLYHFAGLPIFQNRVYHSAEAARACATGDIRLVQHSDTGLIDNAAFDPQLMVYDQDYQNEQAHSAFFQDHLDVVLRLLDSHFASRSMIEVGCGKGVFLEKLKARGYQVTGLDPAYEGDNPDIIKEYFTAASGIRADGMVLRHVLEHIQNPFDFLCSLRDANGGSGKIYIEVPCFDWICSHCSWFDVFYEHVNYFRLSDFHRMFGHVHHAAHSFNGQYLSIIAELDSLRTPVFQDPPFVFPADFTGSVEAHAKRLAACPERHRVVWGAASKGVIFTIFMERAGVPVHAVVDINPVKQGKYLGVTGLRVHSPEEIMATLPDGSEIIVVNPNYLEEIRRLTDNRFLYRPAN